jgi:NADPH:quinone reductase-like Zn-dependent oxidoreductase
MKVAQYDQYGAPRDVLKIVSAPIPKPGPDELLVRVRASSVNPIDCALRSGYGRAFFEKRAALPLSPGRDIVGEVVAKGASVTTFAPGDAVYASVFYGANAEYIAVPAAHTALKPASLSFIQAAALPFAALTAWTALVKVAGLDPSTTPGKRVLIPRGSGGVGSVGIQLIKAWGGYVASTCSTRNVELVKSLGADLVVDYTKQELNGVFRDFDVAFDTSFDTEQVLLDALKIDAGARYVSVVSPKLKLIDEFGLEEGLRQGERLLAERKQSQAALGRGYDWVFAELDGAALRTIAELVDAGKLRPVLNQVFPFERIAEAHEHCETVRSPGRIVIDLQAS